MKPVGALNVATTLRNGTRLSTAEVIAIVYDVCRQLEAGTATTLPGFPGDLWITDAGTVVIDAPASAVSPRAAVASLLDTMLPLPSQESTYEVPAALRTLPDRLRASGNSTSGDYRDLIAILQRYLPSEPKELLEQLVRRHTAGAAEDDLAGLIAETTPEESAPAVPPTPVSRMRARAFMAATMLALAASAYAGYRWSRSTAQPEPRNVTPEVVAPSRRSAVPAFTTGHLVTQPLLIEAPQGAFSPSFGAGNTIVFHMGRLAGGQIAAITVDDRGRPSAAAPLFQDTARNYHARLSPDGTQLAFDSDRDGRRGVYISRRDGSDRRRVSGDGYAAVPNWSPDGSRLSFIKGEPARSQVWNLWMLDVGSGNLRRLTSFHNGQAWGASWFPNGNEIAYSHEDRLFITRLSAATTRHFDSPVPGKPVRTPAVSADGRHIIFQVYRDGVWLLNVESGRMERILDDPTAEEFAWEPGGRRIAYHSRRDGQWRIWLMDTSPPDR
ncbi:MAG: hypothetical protein K2Y23_11635 [Cyanobacteria bacterium]|nr:hypothetical protein [Cyanobacteriota bacterium]